MSVKKWLVLVSILIIFSLLAVGCSPKEGRTDYRDWDDYVTELLEIEESYSELVNLHEIGHSHENRPIYALEISSEEGTNDGRPESLHMGMHHGCEWPSGEMAIDLAWHLLENYKTDAQVTAIVDNIRVWIIPVVNPDGFIYSADESDASWRKNRRPLPCGNIGVDLNRNYSYMWDTFKREGEPSDGRYRGPDPFSELELQGIRDLYLERHIVTTITGHTVAGMILWPWAYNKKPAPDTDVLKGLAFEMNDWSNYIVGQWNSTLYGASGEATDWIYGVFRGLAYTFEYGDQFFIPPYEDYLAEFEKNLPAFLHNIEQSAHYSSVISGKLTDANGNPLDGELELEIELRSPLADGTFINELQSSSLSVTTSGKYEWHVLPSKQPELTTPPYKITAGAPGMYSETFYLSIDSYGEKHEIDFVLRPALELMVDLADPFTTGTIIPVEFKTLNRRGQTTPMDSVTLSLYENATLIHTYVEGRGARNVRTGNVPGEYIVNINTSTFQLEEGMYTIVIEFSSIGEDHSYETVFILVE